MLYSICVYMVYKLYDPICLNGVFFWLFTTPIDSWDAPPRMGLLHLEHKKKQLLSSTGKFNL